ncbi:hypothetical protein F4553_004489 [Allocatelliglobosispora scoriae]|uniref:Uncharacterized protein n=1 Tax=Allocatelliglobosispora scoriae TaxID=643052 RepID=A0A841BWJ1_9ACTN|nr:hypothetical protein [Allocatelliglobosispora scoriae]
MRVVIALLPGKRPFLGSRFALFPAFNAIKLRAADLARPAIPARKIAQKPGNCPLLVA